MSKWPVVAVECTVCGTIKFLEEPTNNYKLIMEWLDKEKFERTNSEPDDDCLLTTRCLKHQKELKI